MNKLEKWLVKNKPLKKKSNLHDYKEEILKMVELNYTQNQICEYLKDIHQVETTQQNVSSFLKREQHIEKPKVKNPQVLKTNENVLSDEDETKAKVEAFAKKMGIKLNEQ